jgi:phosphate transport system substrate-binding protein
MKNLGTLVALLSLCGCPAAAADSWHLVGSTTVNSALEPQQSELESQAGHQMEFMATSSALGLEALAKGYADIAMISSPLAEVAVDVNAKTKGLIDQTQYRAAPIGTVKLRFVVNPQNPIRRVTAAQLSDLLCGKIKSWSEIGGIAAPVQIVAIGPAGARLRDAVMHGGAFPESTRIVRSADQIASIVAATPNAIGIISEAHKRGLTSILQTGVEIDMPLFLVTRGEPDSGQSKLIEAAKAVMARLVE